MSQKKIQSALISVFHKTGLDPIIEHLKKMGVTVYSTGGTQKYIEAQGMPVHPVETLTGYPSILDGRVKTLHPKVFGGILARREADHQSQLTTYEIPEIDLVIVDLYPFEETVAQTNDEATIIEKIDIGGIALIRAAAKNFNDVTVIASQDQYPALTDLLESQDGSTSLEHRKDFARKAFAVTSNYDTAIYKYFLGDNQPDIFRESANKGQVLRYGENPHQQATFYGPIEDHFEQLHGKALSFNNLVDVDAAIGIMREFASGARGFCCFEAY